MRSRLRGWCGLFAVLLAGWVQVQTGWAIPGWPGWTYPLTGATAWGMYPECTPTLAGNMIYVTTSWGGTGNNGALLRKAADGSGLTVPIYEFGSVANGGILPAGQIQPAAGALYGMTTYGGTNNQGTLYVLDTNTMAVTLVHHLPGPRAKAATPVARCWPMAICYTA